MCNRVMDISSIKEKVAFIRINATYDNYTEEGGLLTDDQVKDAVAGCWRIDKKRRNDIEYVFALNEGVVVGIFKVKQVFVLGEANAKGLPGFPIFPQKDRQIDRWVSQFETLMDAEANLGDQYSVFKRAMKKLNKQRQERDKQEVLSGWRKKVYFVFDDNASIPDDLVVFKGSKLIKGKDERFFHVRTPVLYNFEI